MKRTNHLVTASLALALAACGTPQPSVTPATAADPTADGQVYADGNHFRLLALEELPVVAVTADSSSAGGNASRLNDGDLATQWVNGGYRNATAWAALQLAQPATLANVQVKTGPMPAGTSYDLQVSNDGSAWVTAIANQTNTTWNLETKALPANTSGKYVRLFWHNSASAPQPHVSIYEMVANGVPGTTPPSPTPSSQPSTSPSPTPAPSATPTMAPSTSPSAAPSAGPGQLLPKPNGVSTGPSYAGLSSLRVIDGDLNTQWASGDYQAAESVVLLGYGDTAYDFTQVRLKTGALPAGVRYRIEASDDNQTWRAISGDLTNTTWNMETKAVSGTGHYLRVHFYNNPASPIARFSLYEIEVYGAKHGANEAPIIHNVSQQGLFVNVTSGGTLYVGADDPDGDPLTYTWWVEPKASGYTAGTVTGTGSEVSYKPYDFGPTSSGDRVWVRVSDDHGHSVQSSIDTQVYYGSTTNIPASSALQWDPAKAASAQFNGDVTINATGDFAGYGAVVCEYATAANGRQMALIHPGTNTIQGVTGLMYMYLLGPTGSGVYEPEKWSDPGEVGVAPLIPQPNITLSLSGAGGSPTTRTITQANVAGSNHVGYQITEGDHGPEFYAGESTARNGAYPYYHLLEAASSTRYNGDRYQLQIDYRLLGYGDYTSQMLQDWDDDRLFLTDSQGGLGDNVGDWKIYIKE